MLLASRVGGEEMDRLCLETGKIERVNQYKYLFIQIGTACIRNVHLPISDKVMSLKNTYFFEHWYNGKRND